MVRHPERKCQSGSDRGIPRRNLYSDFDGIPRLTLGMTGFLNLVSQARPGIVVEFDLSPAKARDRAPAMLERKFFNLLR